MYSWEHFQASVTILFFTSMTEKVTIGYWTCRGLVHTIKLILEHTQTPYEYKVYHSDGPPVHDKKQWLSVKEQVLEVSGIS